MTTISDDRRGSPGSRNAPRFTLLGPAASGRTYSIARYFNFYASELPKWIGEPVRAVCPGDMGRLTEYRLEGIANTRAWYENYLRWPIRLGQLKSECFHIVDQGLMWYANFIRSRRVLGTVHDVIAYLASARKIDLPAPPLRRRLLMKENVRQLKRLEHLISVSTHTADCLIRELGVPSKRITVIHNHVDAEMRPLPPGEKAAARERWFRGADYVVIHVGKPSAYKNRLGALQAFSLLHSQVPEAKMFLVHNASAEENVFLKGASCRGSVKFFPPLAATQLREFYGAADVLIFPSIYEGFGWPPLEAMACGCPVVSSNAASLHEVVGDAALTVSDPHDHRTLARLLKKVLTENTVAQDLRQRGLARAGQFAPESALAKMAEIYQLFL